MELTTLLERWRMDHLEVQLDRICEQAAKGDLDSTGFLAQALEAEWRERYQRGVASSWNVTATCRELGINHTLFSRGGRQFERYGREGSLPPALSVSSPCHGDSASCEGRRAADRAPTRFAASSAPWRLASSTRSRRRRS